MVAAAAAGAEKKGRSLARRNHIYRQKEKKWRGDAQRGSFINSAPYEDASQTISFRLGHVTRASHPRPIVSNLRLLSLGRSCEERMNCFYLRPQEKDALLYKAFKIKGSLPSAAGERGGILHTHFRR